VVLGGRSASRGAEVVQEITSAGGRAQFVAAELDGSARVSRELSQAALRALGGRIDVLVNNAGIFPGSTTLTVDEATFDEVYAVNVKAPFFLTAAVAPEMTARGSGSIINLGSWVARLGIPVGALYASTKGAMETLTRAWAAEFGSPGVRAQHTSGEREGSGAGSLTAQSLASSERVARPDQLVEVSARRKGAINRAYVRNLEPGLDLRRMPARGRRGARGDGCGLPSNSACPPAAGRVEGDRSRARRR